MINEIKILISFLVLCTVQCSVDTYELFYLEVDEESPVSCKLPLQISGLHSSNFCLGSVV